MIKAVIFDCFGVLYVDPTRYFYEIAKSHGNDAQRERFSELIRQTDSDFISQEEFCEQVAELFQLPVEKTRMKLLKGVAKNTSLVEYSQTLKSRYKVALLSNISRGTMDLFFPPEERSELFDDCVLSAEVGVIKPDPAIYELAAHRLHISPDETVFIDDNARNCDGARQAGMQAIHYIENQQLITDLNQLLGV